MSLKAAEKKPNDDAKEFFLSLDDPRLAFITNKWSRTIVQPLLISLLITSLLSSVLALAQIISRQDIWLPFSLFFLFVTLEGCYTTLWLQQPERRLLNHTAYRAAEFVLLLLLLRLFTWIVVGNWPEFSSLPDILRRPQLILLDAPFIVSGLLGLFGWERAIALGQTFNALSIDQAEVYYYSRPTKERIASDKPVRTNRGAIVFTFFRQWIAGALILAVVTSMSNFDVVDLYRGSSLRAGAARAAIRVAAVFAGLLFGRIYAAKPGAAGGHECALANQRRHAHRACGKKLAPVHAHLAGRHCPAGSVFAHRLYLCHQQPDRRNHYGIIGRSDIFDDFNFYPAGPVPLPVYGRPTRGRVRAIGTAHHSASAHANGHAHSIVAAAPIVDTGLITSSLFWAVAIVMSVTAVSFFLRERGVRLNTAVLQRFWQQLLHWLQITWKEAGHQVQDWQQAVRTRLQRQPKEDEENQPPWRFIRLNSLSPREQIRYFYLSTVKRATDKGVARQQAETPLEFAQDLKENWPEAEEDVDALTEAFLEARYGRSPIEKEDVNPVKKRWRQVKSSLRRK